MMGYNHNNTPAYKHNCESCTFIKSIKRTDGFTIDIYQKCGDPDPWPFLIRYSSEPSDYCTIGIESLAMAYSEKMKGK